MEQRYSWYLPEPCKLSCYCQLLQHQENTQVFVTVTDILGNKVMTSQASVTSGDNLIELQVQDLASGIYLVDVSNGSLYTEKFVKE